MKHESTFVKKEFTFSFNEGEMKNFKDQMSKLYIKAPDKFVELYPDIWNIGVLFSDAIDGCEHNGPAFRDGSKALPAEQ